MQIETKTLEYLGFTFDSFAVHGCYPNTSQVCKKHKHNKKESVQICIAKNLMHCGVKDCGKMSPEFHIGLRIYKNGFLQYV